MPTGSAWPSSTSCAAGSGASHRRAYCYLHRPRFHRCRRRGAAQGAGASHRPGRRLPDRAQGPRAARRGQHAGCRAVGAGARRRASTSTCAGSRRRCRPSGARAVARPSPPPEVVLDRPAHLPDTFVGDDDTKLDLYRRLARAETPDEIDGLRSELRERFGPLPVEAETLLDMARLRVLGATLGIQHILIRGDEARADIPRRRRRRGWRS